MKSYLEVTKEEFDTMASYHRKTEWNNDELAGMVNMVKAYINPHIPSCLSCSSNIRDAKNTLMSFYLFHKEEWETIFEKKEIPQSEATECKCKGKCKCKTKAK